MFVKQIGMEKALELAAKGMEIKVLAPIGRKAAGRTWSRILSSTCLRE